MSFLFDIFFHHFVPPTSLFNLDTNFFFII